MVMPDEKPLEKPFGLLAPATKPVSAANISNQQTGERQNELLRLLRTMEERYTNLNRKLDVLESNFLAQQKKMNKDSMIAESDLVEMKKELSGFSYKLNLLSKELSLCARKGDVDTLRKYLEFWQPMDFIRRDEAERFIQLKQQQK